MSKTEELIVQWNAIVNAGSDNIEENIIVFAKLIINECCDQVRAVDALEIKSHFGIK